MPSATNTCKLISSCLPARRTWPVLMCFQCLLTCCAGSRGRPCASSATGGRYQARKVYLLYRRRVVRLQCAWRSKLARRELRQRRASQREAGKLLQVGTVETFLYLLSAISWPSISLMFHRVHQSHWYFLYVILCVCQPHVPTAAAVSLDEHSLYPDC